jgi:hypothetical protein
LFAVLILMLIFLQMQMARQAYQCEMRKAFAFEGCWLILHQCPKWNAQFETKMARSRRGKAVAASPASQDSPNTPTTPGTDGSGEVQRPEGSKKSKARKRKNTDSMELI